MAAYDPSSMVAIGKAVWISTQPRVRSLVSFSCGIGETWDVFSIPLRFGFMHQDSKLLSKTKNPTWDQRLGQRRS